MTYRSLLLSAAAVSLALVGPAAGQTDTHQTDEVTIRSEIVTDGLEHPWGMDFFDDGSAIVTERPGRLRLLVDGALSDPIEGVPQVWAQGQGGLLDVAIAADYEETGTIYFTFSEPGDGGAGTALARARLDRSGDTARVEDVETIFSMNRKTTGRQHFGSRIVLNPDGTVFVTTGDRGQGPRSQDMQDHAGAVLRINPDGSIPEDNPSPDGSAHLPEIWSKGHRNVQGATWDAVTDALWTHEHGPRGGDELHRPQAGVNYGWPEISYGVNYDGTPVGAGEPEAEQFGSPYYQWTPSIAPSGMISYEGELFPQWRGDFLIGALAFELVSRLDRDEEGNVTGEERMFEGTFGRIRDIAEAPDGSVWLVTDDSNGRLIRLTPAD